MIVSDLRGEGQSRGLRGWLAIAARRRYWILGGTALGFAVAALYVATRPVHYTAEAVVALEVHNRAHIPDQLVSPMPQDSAIVRTELDVISSRSIAEKVLDRVGPPPASKPVSERVSWLLSFPRMVLSRVLRQDDAAEKPAVVAELAEKQRQDEIDGLLDGLRAANDGRSYTIFINYSASDPAYAAAAANAFANVYLEQQTASQAATAAAANDWLGTKVTALRSELDRAEQAVQSYRQETHQFLAKGGTPTEQRAAALIHELSLARTARIEAEAKYQTAKTLAQTDAGMEAFGDVMKSETITALRKQQAEMARNLAGLDEVGVGVGPGLTLMRSRLASVKKQIKEETDRVLSSLGSEVEVAKLKEKQLGAMLGTVESQLANESGVQLHLAQLEREASASRTFYETLLARYKQTFEQERLAAPEARLLSSATPPDVPADKTIPLLILGLLGGFGAGIGGGLLREVLDDRLRSAEHAETIAGVPVLARVPALDARQATVPQLGFGTNSLSGYAQPLGRLAAVVSLAPALRSAQVIMISSSGAKNDKTAACVSLARSLALTGKKVIVVDTDLRRPGIAGAFAIPANCDLSSLILGEKTVDEVVRLDVDFRVNVVPTQAGLRTGPSLLGSDAFRLLIGELRRRFDVIILDTPPLAESSEAVITGTVADATLFVVRLGETSAEHMTSDLRHLALCGVAVSGILAVGDGKQPSLDGEPVLHEPEPAASRNLTPWDWKPSALELAKAPAERPDGPAVH